MLMGRVLITGANGLVGQELVRRMADVPDYDVLATGRDAVPRIDVRSGGYVGLDVTDAEAVRRLFLDFTPDVVVNLAAMTNVDACETDRPACWKANATAVETLADMCLRTGSRLVQVSTDFVFDGTAPLYRETARPNPVNFYAKSKFAGENAARGAGIDRWAVVRPALIFGTRTPSGRGNVVLWVLEKLSKGEKIRVVTDQWRTPTYAPDLAAGLERLVRFDKSGIYHMTGREYLSVYDFALLIARVFDLDASLIEPVTSDTLTAPAARPPRTGLLILKAESELGYRPRPLEDALRHLGHTLGIPVT